MAAVALLAVALAVMGEAVARERIAGSVAHRRDAVPGVTVSPAGGLVLWQVLTGRVELSATATDAVLTAYGSCRSGRDISVHATPTGLVVGTTATVRGLALPMDVTLQPRRVDGAWALAARSVTVGGISVPADRALRLLGGADGAASRSASRLLDGIRLPGDSRFTVTGLDLAEGSVRARFTVPTAGAGDAGGAERPGPRSCLHALEG